MTVDKNLFLYDLAVVAMMRNEARYVKEWLDYYLTAGVNHFYILDNKSTDNFKEVLQPYIDAGIVDYSFYRGRDKHFMERQIEFFDKTFKAYRFFCRYMAFVDSDEFIFPKSNKSIAETVDEILKDKPNAGGLAVNWQCFGSNFQEKADYSKGVLERFTRRAPDDWGFILKEPKNSYVGNIHIKTIANPRTIDGFGHMHFPIYFENYSNVNEQGKVVSGALNIPVSTEKIVLNHYVTKSKEESLARGRDEEGYNRYDRNEIFDDGILKYRDSRLQNFKDITPIDYEKITAALVQNLAPTLAQNVSKEFFTGKLETFLTCRALSSYLKNFLPDKNSCKILEETALNAIQKTLYTTLQPVEVQLLFSELPKILPLDYPVVKDIRNACIQFAEQIADLMQPVNFVEWKKIEHLRYLAEILKTFDLGNRE